MASSAAPAANDPSASTSAQNLPRGPLAGIVEDLRIDNREALLEALRRDPRGGVDGRGPRGTSGGGAGAGAGGLDAAGGSWADRPGVGRSASSLGGADSAGGGGGGEAPDDDVAEQRLVFGSADLRRVLLWRAIRDGAADERGALGGGSVQRRRRGKKGNKNATREEAEEDVLRDLNESLGPSARVAGTPSYLSPRGDGTVVRPNGGGDGSPAGGAGGAPGNPFSDDADDQEEGDDAPITTYILRGGGFDLPSLAAAARHRRRALARAASSRQVPGDPRFRSVPSHSVSHQGTAARSTGPKAFRFLFVPRVSEAERSFLRALGVEEDGGGGTCVDALESLPVDLIPLDDDVLSLELGGGSPCPSLPSDLNEGDRGAGGGAEDPLGEMPPASAAAAFRRAEVEGCPSDVADIVARSLLKLQLLNRGTDEESIKLKGAISRVQGLGPLATAVIDRMMMLRMEEERMEAREQEEEEEEGGYHPDGGDMHETAAMGSSDGMDQDEVNAAGDEVEVAANGEPTGMDWHEEGAPPPPPTGPVIHALLVIDRKVDLVTPMLTPLTYEGLIDDVLQIRAGGCVSVKKSVVEPDDDDEDESSATTLGTPPQNRRRRHPPGGRRDPPVLLPLCDSDPLYAEVRDRHVETFGSFLQDRARSLRESHARFTDREGVASRDLTEIHRFVKQMPAFARDLRSLTNHIHVAELVKKAAEGGGFRRRWQTERGMLESEPCYEALEDTLAEGEPPYRWLRLLCLQSLTSNGIKATRYDALRREAVQAYGYEFLGVLRDLERAGFLRRRETFFMDSMATSYSTLRKSLTLIDADVDPSRPEDAAYVSSGYAPMTVRWVQAAMRGYTSLDEALKELPATGGGAAGGRLVDVEQRWPPEGLAEALKRKRGPSLGAMAKALSERRGGDGGAEGGSDKPVLLVYFVGGVTFMELAALRFLSRRPSFPYSIVCCTTEVVNGGTLLRSLSC